MTDLERYLKLATWSLWGQQKKIVRMELEAHIEHKVWKYQMRGFSHAQAVEKTLADLGQPHVISAGMTGVYTMPNVIRNTGLMILLSSLGIGAITGQAQITGTTTYPIPDCLAGKTTDFQLGIYKISCQSNLIWLHKPSLKAVLEKSGVKVNTETDDWSLMSFSFPESLHQINIRTEAGMTLGDGKGNFVEGDPMYLSGQYFFEKLPVSSLPVSLEGWENPLVRVGKTQFTLDQKDAKFSSSLIYWTALFSSIRNLVSAEQRAQFSITNVDHPVSSNRNSSLPQRKIRITNSKANEVYVIATRVTRTNQPDLRVHEIRPVLQNGEITIHTGLGKLQFANSNKEYYTNTSFNAIIYKFFGRLDTYEKLFEVVPASEIQVVQ